MQTGAGCNTAPAVRSKGGGMEPRLVVNTFWLAWSLLLCLGGAIPGGALAAEPLRIAVLAARTGDAAPSNLAMFTAARFAVDELNAAGGVLGRPLEIVELDNASSALGSRVAAEQAVQEDVLAVIGASWSEHSNAMAPVLQQAGIPMITPVSTHRDVTLHGDFIFRVCYTDPFQGRVMARFAVDDLQARTAAILVNVSRSYSLELADYFQQHFTAYGGRVLWRGEYTIDTADYAHLLRQVQQQGPDVLYVPGDYRDSSFIIKQARDLGLSAVILGGDAFGLRLYDYIGAAADGCYYTTHWHRDSPAPLSRDFVHRYEAAHGEIKQTTVPLTYDAVMLLADAVRRAGSADRAAVREALANTVDFQGVSGSIAFDANGDPVKPVVINRLENGGVRFIRSVEP